MVGIERANPDTLGGLFSSFDDANWTDKNKLSDARLKDLVEHMSSLKVGNQDYSADVMGDAYEYLIKKFADLSKKNAGEFYTPRSVVKLMVRLLKPKSGESVYDPACGTGGMLIEAIRNMDNAKASYEGTSPDVLTLLGTQVVAGTNYAFLAKGQTDTDTPRTAVQVVTVYEDLEGNAKISNICTLDMESFDE
jgi:type I restriction-modification system DNA methylase subunit